MNLSGSMTERCAAIYLFDKDADFVDLLKAFSGPGSLPFAMQPIVQSLCTLFSCARSTYFDFQRLTAPPAQCLCRCLRRNRNRNFEPSSADFLSLHWAAALAGATVQTSWGLLMASHKDLHKVERAGRVRTHPLKICKQERIPNFRWSSLHNLHHI